MHALLHPSSDSELSSILASNPGRLVVIDAFATWCGPCRFIAPKFEQLPREFPEAVFVKMDVDQLQQSAAKLGITAMPTILYFKDGQKLTSVVGADWNKIYSTVKSNYIVPPPKPAPKKDLPPVKETYEQLMTHPVKDLKHMLEERGISYAGLFEKSELAMKLLEKK
ncbi:thioredoxin-like protein [Hyaloraphidium curvatum]|nr:thioredoxin-like protein [Hyaloraphidium curvatum]